MVVVYGLHYSVGVLSLLLTLSEPSKLHVKSRVRREIPAFPNPALFFTPINVWFRYILDARDVTR
jgi:hypothetical protein